MNAEAVIGASILGFGLYLLSKTVMAAEYIDTASQVTGQTPLYTDTGDIWGTAPESGPSYSGDWWNFGQAIDYLQTPPNVEIVNPSDWETSDLTIPIGDVIMGTNWKVNEYPKYAVFISGVESKYNIQPDLLARLLYQESRYRQDVIEGVNRSPVGALGIAQFMPATASWLHVNPLDPFQAIDGAGKYLKMMYDKFHTWQYALMAYNWGPGNLSNYLQGKTTTVPPETQKYVAQISADVAIG